MTQEDKELLLKDLCARLPYGVIGYTGRREILANMSIKGFYKNMSRDGWHPIEQFKPYLRPMSSMTKEEENEYRAINCYEGLFPRNEDALDYILSHHLDFRDLIPIGLALEAPEGMYKIE